MTGNGKAQEGVGGGACGDVRHHVKVAKSTAEDSTKAEPSLAHLRIAKVEGSRKGIERPGWKLFSTVLSHVVSWWEASTEGQPHGQKEKDEGKIRTSGFCRDAAESAKGWIPGYRDKKETPKPPLLPAFFLAL